MRIWKKDKMKKEGKEEFNIFILLGRIIGEIIDTL